MGTKGMLKKEESQLHEGQSEGKSFIVINDRFPSEIEKLKRNRNQILEIRRSISMKP